MAQGAAGVAPVRECPCKPPVRSADPRRKGKCAACGLALNPDWLSSDETIAAFFDALAEATFPAFDATGKPMTSPVFERFRRLCEHRERAGRTEFGLRYLNRDNVAEAEEEAADLANYAFFRALQHVREGGGLRNARSLRAAFHAFKALEALR
jgi:hypothetical protein